MKRMHFLDIPWHTGFFSVKEYAGSILRDLPYLLKALLLFCKLTKKYQ
jgi:hypothetical protein